jgi:hypothetical protein
MKKKTQEPEVKKKKAGKPFDKQPYSQKYAIAFDYFSDPRSETFDNAYKSALKAGFPDSSAKTITVTKWWQTELVLLMEEVPKARQNISEILNMEVTQQYKDKETGEILMSVVDPKLLKIKADMSTFVAEHRASKLYSKKVNVENLNAPQIEENEQLKKLFGIK